MIDFQLIVIPIIIFIAPLTKINCLTFPVNDTQHAEYNDRNKYSSKNWHHEYFIVDDIVVICTGLVCFLISGRCCSVIPSDNFNIYRFCSFLRMSCCVGAVDKKIWILLQFSIDTYRCYIFFLYNWSFVEHSLIVLRVLKKGGRLALGFYTRMPKVT